MKINALPNIKAQEFSKLISLDPWDTNPVSIEKFVLGRDYLNIGKDIYPRIYDILIEIFGKNPKNFYNYNDIFIIAGIGSGKSYIGAISQAYIFYKLQCLKDPLRYFGGAQDKPIALVNCAPSAQKAKDLIYKPISRYLTEAECFAHLDMKIQTRETQVFNKSRNMMLNIFSGSSTPNSIIGRNVLSCIIDEACFFEKSADMDYYKELYDGAKGRITSRFGDKGFIMSISSPVSVNDQCWKNYEHIKREGTEIYIAKSERIRAIQN
jgi:hypothetical protein